jgi:hypothetical protein
VAGLGRRAPVADPPLLVYLWYELPTKCVAPLESRREVAAALAGLLEQIGAGDCADLCGADEVEEMLAL